jgi:hypothetical protein
LEVARELIERRVRRFKVLLAPNITVERVLVQAYRLFGVGKNILADFEPNRVWETKVSRTRLLSSMILQKGTENLLEACLLYCAVVNSIESPIPCRKTLSMADGRRSQQRIVLRRRRRRLRTILPG